MQSHKKIAAVKPVASRPFSSSRCFSKLLKDFTATGSPRITSPEEAIIIRRPKATRFTPPLSDLSTEIAATILQDGDSDATHEQVDVDTKQVVSCDHQTVCHNVRKPINSVKNRLSYDGYNWRKYGQKKVKGSEFPRSYYKCTHPSCPVKRKVETALDGRIAEIVYNGEHNHPKPHPPKKPLPSTSTEIVVFDAYGTNDAGVASQIGGCNRALGSDIVAAAFRSNCDCLDEFGKTSEVGDGNKSTKDKQPSITSGLTAYVEPTPALESSAECGLCGDAFHWRKYGQKAVKGNSFPRSYFRCSTARCNARKYVQRVSDDSVGSFVTTYEGRHNHE